MARRSFFMFLLLNVLVTFAVVFLSLQLFDRRSAEPTARRDPLVVVITATTDPNVPPPVTVVVITATPGAGVAVAAGSTPGVPTLDPTLLPPGLGTAPIDSTAGIGAVAQATATDPSGCPTYTLVSGDVPGAIAQRFGVSTADLLAANDLTEADAVRLQIGQVLIIPVDGCGLVPTVVATITSTRVVLPTQPATATLAPTASNSDTRLEVVGVISPGDITEEGIDIRNVSVDVINIEGWTLSDGKGNSYTFPNFQMFGGRRVIIYTRAGSNTPAALFWGLSQPVWGDLSGTVTIRDANGAVVMEYPLSRQSVIGGTAP